jgi:hypothetical protein
MSEEGLHQELVARLQAAAPVETVTSLVAES